MANLYTKDELTTIYNGLPDPVRDAVFAPETFLLFNKIQKEYQLETAQRDMISMYSELVLMGVLPPEMFVKMLAEKLGVKHDTAAFIAQRINRDLFNPLKEYLKEIHGISAKEAEPEKPVEAPQAPRSLTPPPPAPTLPAEPPPVVRPKGEPVRSDWGWHGTKNEITGKIEFRHEEVPQGTVAGALHVGSIFEQKLGGILTMKNDGAALAEKSVPPKSMPTPSTPPATPTIKKITETPQASAPAKLRVPKKPTQVAIPPVQVFQQPKN